jgi:arylsulfatase A-like enzyme
MNPHRFSPVVFLLLVAALHGTNAFGQQRPNILLILPDQLRAAGIGCMGNSDVRTPHIDQLARDGMHFRRTYANVPVCCPARATLLTGKYAHKNGMIANDLRLRESEITIAEILRDAGYRTGFVGKWHLDGGPRNPGFVPPGPRRQGFEYWAAYECHHQHFTPSYFRDTPEMIIVPKFEPEASCDFAVEFLKTQPKEQPFFLTIQMGPPHDPYGAPESYMKLYDPEKLTMRPNWQAGSEAPGGRAANPGVRRPDAPNAVFVPRGGKEEVAAYYAATTAIDDQVGRLMRTLREQGLDENTIVLFTSDHGDMLGSHGLRRKRKPHEESAHVPGIIRWPAKIPKAQVSDVLFSHVDMPATLLGLAGVPVPDWMQGADLSQVALGRSKQGPDAVLLQIFVPFNPDGISTPWRGIVTDRYTYARYENAPWVLFDNQNDPWQKQNLATDPAHAKLVRTLDTQLETLMAKQGDSWSFNSSDHMEEGGRLYRTNTFYTVQEYLAWAKANPAEAK